MTRWREVKVVRSRSTQSIALHSHYAARAARLVELMSTSR